MNGVVRDEDKFVLSIDTRLYSLEAVKKTAYKYSDGAPYTSVGGYTSSYDKGTGLVDVVAAATSLGARPAAG